MVTSKDKYFQQMTATNKIISQPEPFKNLQLDNIINTSGRKN